MGVGPVISRIKACHATALDPLLPIALSPTPLARPQMGQALLRDLMPALANKTYFNNPALPFCTAEKRCTPWVLGTEESGY